MDAKRIFLEYEGDEYFNRNFNSIYADSDIKLNAAVSDICATGWGGGILAEGLNCLKNL